MSPGSKVLIALGALSMVLTPVVATASGATLPAQTSRPVGAYLPGTTAGLRGGTLLAILGVAAIVIALGASSKGHGRSR